MNEACRIQNQITPKAGQIGAAWAEQGEAGLDGTGRRASAVYLSIPNPGRTTGRSGRQGTAWIAVLVDAGQNKVPTFPSPLKLTAPLALQRTVNNHFFAGKNRGNSIQKTDRTKPSS